MEIKPNITVLSRHDKATHQTIVYKDHCNISQKPTPINTNYFNLFGDDIIENTEIYSTIKNGDRFYEDKICPDEKTYVKNYGNTMASVYMSRRTFVIEETDNKISIKMFQYSSVRGVTKKFFRVRRTLDYLTFNYKTKLFYTGCIVSKKKNVINKNLYVNPNVGRLSSFFENYTIINEELTKDGNFNLFFNKIWDKIGLKSKYSLDHKPTTIKEIYALTKYLIYDIKLPNQWSKLSDLYFTKVDYKKGSFNLVETIMKKYDLKGTLIRKLLNESQTLNLVDTILLYQILGVDKFSKLKEDFFKTDKFLSKCEYIDTTSCKELPKITNKEKDCLLSYFRNIKKLEESNVRTVMDHIGYRKTLNDLGEMVRIKAKTVDEFNLEHQDWSSLISSYRNGDVIRYYGEISDLEQEIKHEDETYYPVLLLNNSDFDKESQHQSNCVRTYIESAHCVIFSIRKGSVLGDERATVEYQYRKNEIVCVQSLGRFNNPLPEYFKEVVKKHQVMVSLFYKTKTLKLPKMIKTYRNGNVVENQSVFNMVNNGDINVFHMTPKWEKNLPTNPSFWDQPIQRLVDDFLIDELL